VEDEVANLKAQWRHGETVEAAGASLVDSLLGAGRAAQLDRFERVQLEDVLRACQAARSLSEAGRALFAASRSTRSTTNDADRLRKYLGRYGLSFATIQAR